MPVFKVFASAEPHCIQGIGFRELVEKIANDSEPTITGQAKNRKREEDVEIQAFFVNEQEFSFFLEKIREKANKKLGIRISYSPLLSSDSNAFFPKGFEVVREDELKEMFWALSGAKREFGELHRETTQAKKKRETLMLFGLEAELKRLKEIFAPETEPELTEYAWFSISRFLTEPFDAELNIVLTDLNSALQVARGHRKKGELGNLLDKINRLIDEARNKIKERTILSDRETEEEAGKA